jgi:predicted kinase
MENTQVVTDVERLADSLGQLPEPVARPAFIVVSGLPGTGKSYFCGKLAERLPLAVLESDALRKVLFSPPSYSSQENSRLFSAVHRLIERLLKRGVPLVLDATNLSEQHREYLYNIADQLGAQLVLVRVEAPPQLVRERLESRLENPESKSDADWTIYQKMQPLAQKIRRRHYAVDTSRDIAPVLDKIVREVRQ